MTATVGVGTNPYVGPRAFRPGEPLHGRDREVVELLDLLLAERIVLLHSPSGAGKTSLVQAALVHRLEEEGFEVLPVIRVKIAPPTMAASAPGPNRYALSALMSLQQNVPLDDQLDGSELAALTLDRYLTQRGSTADNQVLIFDQFEEVLLDPADHSAKRQFFAQLADALRPRERWALFLVRDDFVAALDQYLRALPTRARTRFRLDFLSRQAARQAVQRPAERMGIPFAERAVDKLIDDLSQVWVQQPDGSSVPKPGPYVEPVQLQVVCLRLWERLPPGRTTVEESDIESAGDVSTALSAYYARQVAEVAARTGTSERAIRDWFDLQLIVEQRFRGQARQGPQDGSSDGRAALSLLEDAHLIRADQRLGTTWYELSHDRLIAPVQDDNARWRQSHLHALQRQAVIWNDEGRPEGLLFGPRELAEAEAWAAQHPAELTTLDRTFLEAGRREGARERRRRLLRAALIVVTVVAVLLASGALALWRAAIDQGQRANHAARISDANALMTQALADLDVDPQRSVSDALAALEKSPDAMTPEIRDVLYRAVDMSRLRATLRAPEPPFAGFSDFALSPDGASAASAGKDGRVRVWDLTTRRQRLDLQAGSASYPALFVAYGPHNRLATVAFSGSTGKDLVLWDAVTGRPTKTLASDANVGRIAFDRDAGRLADVDDDGNARIWSVDTGEVLQSVPLGGVGTSVAFAPDGGRLALGRSDGTVLLWNPTTGQLQPLLGHADVVDSVAFSGDGRLLVSASEDATARIWDVDTGQTLQTLSGHTNSVFRADFNANADRVATASADGTARIWDVGSGRPVLSLSGHTNPIEGMAFGRSGATLLTASWDGSIRVWDVATTSSDTAYGLALQPVGDRLLATAGTRGRVKIWDVTAAPDPTCAGNAIAGSIKAADTKPIARGPDDGNSSMAISPDGKLLASGSATKTITVWDVASGRPVATLTGSSEDPNTLTWSPRGDLLAAATTGTVLVWRVPSGGEPVQRLAVPYQGVATAVSFNADGTDVAAGDSFGQVTLWNTADGSQRFSTPPHTAHIFNLAFDPRPGSNLLATASVDKTAKLLNTTTGATVAEIDSENAMTDVAFSADGTRLATASWDRTARIWNVADTKTPQLTITHAAQVDNVAFASPDGHVLVAATADHQVHVYDVDDQNLLTLARCRAGAG